MTDTIAYYNTNADAFAEGTVHVNFDEVGERFLKYLSPASFLLDLGCGAGRDTKYFLEKGYRVDAVDGSEELCKLASAYTGIPVRCMLFQELEETELYDGIWACASLLHVPSKELPDVFERIVKALKTNGILYASFKYGDFEGDRNGRYFTDFTEASFDVFLERFPMLKTEEQWLSGDVREGRGNEKWLNLILRKE